jgi:hypothetical protein
LTIEVEGGAVSDLLMDRASPHAETEREAMRVALEES